MELKNPDVRHLNDIKEVLYDQAWAKNAPNLELYFMYRGLELKNGLRYDITTMPFQMLGQEFNKTKGHSHPKKYSELYQVLEGTAIYLMQKIENDQVKDVYAVQAKKGDKVFIPAYYGHVTINPGPEDLKMSNWVADEFQSDYSLIIAKQGACYYALNDNGRLKWVKNKNYGQAPALRFEQVNKNIPQNLKQALVGE